MVVLKKIRAATLIETLTASVLIIIVFMIASLSFNSIFTNHQKRNLSSIENRVKELEYLIINNKLKIPYAEDFGAWEIEILIHNKQTTLYYQKEEQKLTKQIGIHQ